MASSCVGGGVMRALLLSGYADRPRTRLVDRAHDPVRDGEVQVRIEASALNPLDAKIAIGAMADWFPVDFPYVPGTDFAGVVERIGAAITDLAVGDPVFGRADPLRVGAVAEDVVIDANLVAHRPMSLPVREAACLPTPTSVALQVLEMISRDDDEPLLILGDGLVARMAASFAGAAARRVIDLDGIAAAGDFRCVIDTVGGVMRNAALERLSPGSHIVTLTSPAAAAMVAAKGVRSDFAVLETSRRQLNAVALAAADGVLRPRIDQVVTLEDSASAFDRYVARDLAGKIVIAGSGR